MYGVRLYPYPLPIRLHENTQTYEKILCKGVNTLQISMSVFSRRNNQIQSNIPILLKKILEGGDFFPAEKR